jgi:hypothetical protein
VRDNKDSGGVDKKAETGMLKHTFHNIIAVRDEANANRESHDTNLP